MARIPGSSQFLNAATLSNIRGLSPSTPTLLSQDSSTVSLLDSGRSLAVLDTGISASARALNSQFLNQSQSLGNEILSLAVGTGATVEGAQLQINALRASIPESQLAPSLRGQVVDQDA